MSRTFRSLMLAGCWTLLTLLSFSGPLPAVGDRDVSKDRKGRVDGQGDPLPEGAVGRLGSVRLRHAGAINRLAFIGTGQALASLGEDSVFHLWESATGKELRRLVLDLPRAMPANPETYDFMVQRMMMMRRGMRGGEVMPSVTAFTADGGLVAAATPDNTIEIWDTTTGKLARRFDLKGAALTVSFSPDGKLVAAAEMEEREAVVRVWDLASWKEVRQLQWPRHPVTCIVFSPDSSLVAGVSSDEVRVWIVGSGKRLRRYDGHESGVTALAFSPDGRSLATAGHDGCVRLWEFDSEEELRKFTLGQEIPVLSLGFSPDGKQLAIGTGENLVRLWDVNNGNEIRQLAGHSTPVQSVAFSPDGKSIAAGGSTGLIRLWDATSGKERLPAKSAARFVSAWFLRDEKTVALGTEEGAIHHWNVAQGKELNRYAGPKDKLNANNPNFMEFFLPFTFAPDGTSLVTMNEQGQLRLWDAARGKEVRQLDGATQCFALGFSPDGKQFAALSGERQVRLWNPATGKELRQIKLGGQRDMEMGMGMRMRNLMGMQGGMGMGMSMFASAFSPDSRVLALVTEDNKVHLWETATGKERRNWRANQSGVSVLAFSPDGSLLATGSPDETIRLWDTLTGKLVRGCVGHRGKIQAVAFSPDSKLLATGSEDHVIRLWEVTTGRELRQLDGHQGAILALAFAPDGKLLISTSTDLTALAWDVQAPQPARKSQPIARLTRPLDAIWADLASPEGSTSYQAFGELAGCPGDAVPFLQQQLHAVPNEPESHLVQLIADLDDKQFAVRDKADRDLEKLGRVAEPPLRKALAGQLSVEARRRVDRLLTKMDEPDLRPQVLRGVRAIEVLERIGTKEAKQVLQTAAKGAPGARLTEEAKASLDRLSKRSAP